MADLVYLLLGIVLGAVIATLLLRGRGVREVVTLREREQNLNAVAANLKAERDALAARAANAETKTASLAKELEMERKAAAEKLGVLDDAQKKLREAFSALSAEALRTNNQQFMDLAKA